MTARAAERASRGAHDLSCHVAERTAIEIREAARTGALTDEVFDRVLAPEWRVRSAVHWTPVAAAAPAIEWLTGRGARSVLDVGAGVGKLCAIGALSTRDVVFVGVEQRPALAAEANRIAALLGLSHRVRILASTLEALDPSAFDAFYLYNPFGEHLDTSDDLIDATVERGQACLERDVRIVDAWLARARHGTRVVTLHGFGGVVPSTYRLVGEREFDGDTLDAWEQYTPERPNPAVASRDHADRFAIEAADFDLLTGSRAAAPHPAGA